LVTVCDDEYCSNNGYCADTDGERECMCDWGFSGIQCETGTGHLRI